MPGDEWQQVGGGGGKRGPAPQTKGEKNHRGATGYCPHRKKGGRDRNGETPQCVIHR